ncbi:hypothetical protein EBZ38_16200, partial [bacterium]|nr:hypothetical protein [bacterium]
DKGDIGTVILSSSFGGGVIITGSLLVSGSFGENVTIAQNLIVSGTITSPGSDRQIIFNNNGVLGSDSDFVFDSNERLGIGTSLPISKLSVNGGNINITNGYGVGGNNLGSYSGFITYHNDGLGFLQSASFGFRGSAYIDSIAYPNLFGGEINDLRFFASTNGISKPSEVMRIVGGTSRVGIGTSTPINTLQVVGGVTATSFTGSFSGSIRAPGSTTQLIFNNAGVLAGTSNITYTNNLLSINTSTTIGGFTHIINDTFGKPSTGTESPILTLTDQERVGIGTIDPRAKLEVLGSVLISGSNTLTNIGPAVFSGSISQQPTFTASLGYLTSTGAMINGNVTVTGRITAEEFHTEFVSASIIYQSGSTQFGNSLDDTHIFTGSLRVNGSITGSLFGTSSWAVNAQTASYAVNLKVSGSITDVDYIDFDTTASIAQPTQARLSWNNTDGTLDLGLKGGNVKLEIGQTEVVRVVNKTNTNLLQSQYKVVRIRRSNEGGAQGQRLAVVLAQANNDPNSVDTIGLVAENINNNEEGFIVSSGLVKNINTTQTGPYGENWMDGDVLYLSPTTAGALTNIKPQAPNH